MSPSSFRPFRLAALASHPIQYHAPLFRYLASLPEIDLQVFFCSRRGSSPSWDPGFQRKVQWDVPLLEGYPHRFLSQGSTGIALELCRGQFNAVWIHGWATMAPWMAWAVASCLHTPILLRGETNDLMVSSGLKGQIRQCFLRVLFSRVAGFLAIGIQAY